MMTLFRFCSALGTWTTLVSLTYPRQVASYNAGESPLKFFFHTPANGSRVDWHDINFTYILYSTRTGRKATRAEVRSFSESMSVCFGLESSSKPPSCSPLDMRSINIKDSVTIKDSEPGAWVTVRATLVVTDGDTTSTGTHLRSRPVEWEDVGDSITLFVELRDKSSLHLGGESSYLSSYSSSQESIMREVARSARGLGGGTLDMDGRLAVRQALGRVFSSYDVTTMLDAGCGDVTWMPYYVDGVYGVQYSGADIEAAVVEDNRGRFEAEGQGADVDEATSGALQKAPAFVQANLIKDVPSSEDGRPFDLILVRDLMSLLPSGDNFRLLERLDDSGAKLLMATTFLEADENAAMSEEDPVGIHEHPINLALPPYCLRPPEAMFVDSGMGRTDHRLALWELDAEKPLLLTGDCTTSSWEGVTLNLSRS